MWLTALWHRLFPTPPRVVSGVAIMAAHRDRSLAARIESAMSAAVLHALATGVSIEDSDTLRRVQMEARAHVLSKE